LFKQAKFYKYGGEVVPKESLQPGERVNYQNDFVMEIVWKLFSFAFYSCAEYFSQYPYDLSKFYLKVEELFNDGLLYRW
jgi:hypothetical protein